MAGNRPQMGSARGGGGDVCRLALQRRGDPALLPICLTAKVLCLSLSPGPLLITSTTPVRLPKCNHASATLPPSLARPHAAHHLKVLASPDHSQPSTSSSPHEPDPGLPAWGVLGPTTDRQLCKSLHTLSFRTRPTTSLKEDGPGKSHFPTP